MAEPLFSVVVPAYNQAEFLGGALRSVLAQPGDDYEVIVVDDGSTDATARVAASFEPRVRCIHQANQGLAGARNAGIRLAAGAYVALLDADDEWLPAFLPAMRRAIARHAGADAFYGAAQCMDHDGRDLPQRAGAQRVPPEELYRMILRANFLIPSTVVLRRAAVERAGLFDPAFRRVQDWELWLRMSRQGMRFVGVPEVLARYRLHESSLSADVAGGQAAALAVVEKHFGPDDGDPGAWPADKRRAYGGLYRYHALTAMLRAGDWDACAAQYRRALLADPTLSRDRAFFHELALGGQRLGLRGTAEGLDAAASAVEIERLLERVFAPPLPEPLARVRAATCGAALAELARVACRAGRPALGRALLARSARRRPALLLGARWWRALARSCFPNRPAGAGRRRRSKVLPT